MTQTYNPILDTAELPRVRIGAPLRSPAMGTALVLEPAIGDPLVIWSGQRVPEARLGNYRRMSVVDVSNHGLSFDVTAPSADPAFPFTVAVSLCCQIADPAAIVRDGIQDMTAALRQSLTRIVRDEAARFDVLNPAGPEAAIMAKLNDAYPVSAVRLSGFAVTVEAVDTAEIITAKRELRVQEMRRDAMRPVASAGRDEMLAHVMALTGGDPTPLLDREQESRDRSTQASLDALRVLMGSSKELEEFNASRVSEQAMSAFFPGGEPLIGSSRGGIRDRLDRKIRGAIDSGRVVEENVAVQGEAGDQNKPGQNKPMRAEDPGKAVKDEPDEANGRRVSRVRGTRPADQR
ncbi:MAG TPA: hypothetical protein VFV67_09325 [Actinophytocola sp.]|uniref:hypothetical protein n=1 Tax=Actinophytocola sp. TaxID=1872138 RepID=UPI002DBD9BD6|nr:hypothetical protein [Actinophytocola sp.]HEU5470841.1 hypothetical protein [Actinophytocola sp.]